MTAFRRLDCVLEPTKDAVLAKLKSLEGGKVQNVEPILNKVAGQSFHRGKGESSPNPASFQGFGVLICLNVPPQEPDKNGPCSYHNSYCCQLRLLKTP